MRQQMELDDDYNQRYRDMLANEERILARSFGAKGRRRRRMTCGMAGFWRRRGGIQPRGAGEE
jgi:hypothetical protein